MSCAFVVFRSPLSWILLFCFFSTACTPVTKSDAVVDLEHKVRLLEQSLAETQARLAEQEMELTRLEKDRQASLPTEEVVEPQVPVEPDPEPEADTVTPAEISDDEDQPLTELPKPEESVSSELLETDEMEPPAHASAHYKEAYGLFEAGNFQKAASFFQSFLDRYPNHELAANALYWLAETAYSESRFNRALIEFRRIEQEYPKSNKVPDAILKVGRCLEKLGQIDEAFAAYDRVIKEYPESRPAQLARQWL